MVVMTMMLMLLLMMMKMLRAMMIVKAILMVRTTQRTTMRRMRIVGELGPTFCERFHTMQRADEASASSSVNFCNVS